MANTHTIFAIIAVCLELPITSLIIKFAEKLIPVLPEENEQLEDRKLQYLLNVKNMPSRMALANAHREIVRMGRIAEKNLNRALDCFFEYDAGKVASVKAREESVDILDKEIDEAMLDLRSMYFSDEALRRISMLNITKTDIERISDYAENIVEFAEEMHAKKSALSEDALKELQKMSTNVRQIVDLSLEIFSGDDFSRLYELDKIEAGIDLQKTELIGHHVDRLMDGECEPLAGIVFTNVVTELERIGDHAENIGYALSDQDPQ